MSSLEFQRPDPSRFCFKILHILTGNSLEQIFQKNQRLSRFTEEVT